MIIVKLQGGLGNQMFQYAFGLSISKKLSAPLYLDLSFFKQRHELTPRKYELDRFNDLIKIAGDKLLNRFLCPSLIQKIFNRTGIHGTTIYRENSLRFNNNVSEVKSSVYFEGFFQNEQYFIAEEDLIRQTFVFKSPLNQESQRVADILMHQPNTVSIHVRRGDYVNSSVTNDLHGVCSANYYLNAIELIKSKINDPVFYFFSDDPEWVFHQLIPKVDNARLVSHNQQADSWQDMALMCKCRHHIIANSSFSWWSAWLNPDKQKIVIAPEKWFNTVTAYFDADNITPPKWIRLTNE
jgi:hypothetical protein